MMRLPGRWVWLTLGGTAVAGVALGLVVSGVPWSSGGRSLPPSRARVYENVDACLLTGARGVTDHLLLRRHRQHHQIHLRPAG